MADRIPTLDAPPVPGWPGAVARPSGEGAVVIEFSDRVDDGAAARVAMLTALLDADPLSGQREVVPTFRSVLIAFDPHETDNAGVLAALPPEPGRNANGCSNRAWRVPVCVDDGLAEDLCDLAAAVGLAPAEVRKRLLANPLRVGMYGFVPGAAYLTGLDPALHTPRRQSPRPPVPAGSLIVAVGQAVLLPVSMPTGWYLVGRTAARMFDAEAQGPPVPFAVGDTLYLEAVGIDALEQLRNDPTGGLRAFDG